MPTNILLSSFTGPDAGRFVLVLHELLPSRANRLPITGAFSNRQKLFTWLSARGRIYTVEIYGAVKVQGRALASYRSFARALEAVQCLPLEIVSTSGAVESWEIVKYRLL